MNKASVFLPALPRLVDFGCFESKAPPDGPDSDTIGSSGSISITDFPSPNERAGPPGGRRGLATNQHNPQLF